MQRYDVKSYNFSKDYIIIEVSNYHPSGESKEFCFINADGQYIDSLNWASASGIYHKTMNKSLTYEINSDSFILYKANNSTNGAYKIKYTITKDYLDAETLETYDSNDIILAGK